MPPLKIIFMGTPDFACPSLGTLLASKHLLVSVVTQPDRPRGRGRKMLPPPVKTLAEKNGCPILQPESIKSTAFLDRVEKMDPDLIVTIAYGQILPEGLIRLPRLGAINVHASLLPKYRGAAPIQWAIRNQEIQTGITTMQMDTGLDTGDILLQAPTPITETDTAQSLHDRLAEIGADLLIETLAALQNQELTARPQDDTRASYAPMLKKSDGHIDWQLPATGIDALVRAFTPWPGAFCYWEKRRLKILRTVVLPLASFDPTASQPPGTILEGFDNELRIATGEGALSVTEIQGASGRRQPIESFLRGCRIPVGARLT